MTPVTKSQARGATIAFARTLRGLTQEELADEIGVSRNTLLRTERGHRVVDVDELEDIAEALQVPMEWLLSPPLPSTVELGPWVDCDVPPAHNVHVLDAHGEVIEGPWGDSPPDGGTPVQAALPWKDAA